MCRLHDHGNPIPPTRCSLPPQIWPVWISSYAGRRNRAIVAALIRPELAVARRADPSPFPVPYPGSRRFRWRTRPGSDRHKAVRGHAAVIRVGPVRRPRNARANKKPGQPDRA